MGDGFSLAKLGCDTWDKYASVYDNLSARAADKCKAAEDSLDSAIEFIGKSALDELKTLERQPKVGEEPGQPKPQKAKNVADTSASEETPPKKDYPKELDTMVDGARDAIRETLCLPEGKPLPREMKIVLGLSKGTGGQQTVNVLKVDAGPRFIHRVNNLPVVDRLSSHLSVAARGVYSKGFPPYVDLTQFTNGRNQIIFKVHPDGTYELVNPQKGEGEKSNLPVA